MLTSELSMMTVSTRRSKYTDSTTENKNNRFRSQILKNPRLLKAVSRHGFPYAET